MLSETDKKYQHAIKNFILKQYKCSTDAEAFSIMKRLANGQSESQNMCKAFIANGLPCSRRAKTGCDFCKTHINKAQLREKRDIQQYPCVFFDEKEDTFVFCKNNAIHGKLVCNNHEYLQQSYFGMYGCRNIPEYLANEKSSNTIIETIVKKHGLFSLKETKMSP